MEIKENKTISSRLTRWIDRIIPFAFKIELMPGAKIGLADYLSRLSLYDNTFTVAKLRSINNSFGYQVQKITGRANSKSNKSIVSANESKIGKNNRQLPPDEGGKSCDRSTSNQKVAICIIECNDREGAKIVKSITYCQLRESEFNSILQLPKQQIPNGEHKLEKTK